MKFYKRFLVVFSLIIVSFCFISGHSYPNEIDDIREVIKKKGANWIAEENSISVLSPEERKKRLGALEEFDSYEIREYEPTLTVLPNSFDWRNVNGNSYITDIRNQGSCPSCWAFASVAALESKLLMQYSYFNPSTLDLSEQIVLSCSGAGNCEYGGYVSLASNFLIETGTSKEECYHYRAANGNCDSACDDWEENVYKISSWGYVINDTLPDSTHLTKIQEAIYTKGPVIAWFKVYTDFYYYDSGVYSHVAGSYEDNHTILVIGWDNASNTFIAKNSWGRNWGENGYFKIAYSEIYGDTEFGRWTYYYGDSVQSDGNIEIIILPKIGKEILNRFEKQFRYFIYDK